MADYDVFPSFFFFFSLFLIILHTFLSSIVPKFGDVAVVLIVVGGSGSDVFWW